MKLKLLFIAVEIELYTFYELPCSNRTQQNVCRISVRTVLEGLDMAQNLVPMIPLITQIYIFDLIIILVKCAETFFVH